MQDVYLTIKDLAKYLKVKQSTIYNWVNNDLVPVSKVVGQWRFKQSEIDEWIKNGNKNGKQNNGQKVKKSGRFALVKEPEKNRIEEDEHKDTIEKREFFRLDKKFPVRYNLAKDPNRIFNATGNNISEGGIFIETEDLESNLLSYLKIHKVRLTLIIEFPHDGHLVQVDTELVWSINYKKVNNRMGLGLKFCDIAPEAHSKVHSYIQEYDISANGMPQLRLNTPIHFESTIVVKQSSESVYELLANINSFPEFIDCVKSVNVINKTEDQIISEWSMEIDGLLLNWQQLNKLDKRAGFIRFKLIKGDFDKYAGEWRIKPLLTGTEITLTMIVDWGMRSVLRKYVEPILEKKTKQTFHKVLDGLKNKMWSNKTSELVKFAFMVHPYDLEVIDIQFNEPACRTKRKWFLEKMFEYTPPFDCAHVTGVHSLTGKKIEGELIYFPFLPKQILTMDSSFIFERVVEAAKIAESTGAKILGLGAYTAGVGRKGVFVAKALNIPVTTGTSYTIAIGIEATLKAAGEMGINLKQAKVVIIGATGAVGGVFSQILAEKVSRLTLVARNENKLRVIADFIAQNSRANVEYTKDINQAVGSADIIVTATSTPGVLIDMKLIRPGTLIYDMSVPKNIPLETANQRRDVLVVDGGTVRPPGEVNFNFYFGLAPGECYACMAETMILTLEERFESYSIGGNISLEKVKEIAALGAKHGFKIAALRSFGRQITKAQIEQVRRSR
ncbi:SRPBCC family protein [Candidatus Omnitrophota bacterium]